MKHLRFDLFAILLVTFSGSFGFGLVIPFLVILITRFGGNSVIYGLVSAVYPLCQSISSPLLGKLSDTMGRKPILAISQAGTLIGWIVLLISLFLPIQVFHRFHLPLLGIFSVTLPLVILSFARSIDGLTGGNVSVAQAYIADISTEKDRASDYGKLSIASNIGFIVGPALAGLLSVTFLGEKLPVIFAIFISLIALFFILVYLPESHVGSKKKIIQDTRASLATLLRIEPIRIMLFLYFVLYIGFNFFYVAFPVYATSLLHWSVTKMGIYFSFLSLLMIISQGPLLSIAAKRWNDAKLAMIGAVILGSNFLLITTGNEYLIYVAALFFAVGNGFMWPSILSLLSKAAGEKYQGVVQGWAGSASGIASIIGLIAGGILFTFLKSGIFFIAAFFIYIVLVFAHQLLGIEKKQKV